MELEQIALDAGLPEGVLNVVVGPGRVVGERLAKHPDVAKIAFTGSTAVGRRVGELAAQSIKRVTLELGGKSANIVFADADLEAAAASAPLAVFGNAGQDCCARSRILVEHNAVERFLELLERAVVALRVGDPLDDTTEMGPLISAEQREQVGSYLDDSAPIAIQGSAPEGRGYWFPPTVLAPVSNDDRAAREEIFGPIAAVIPFDDEADAVRIANDTVYGLSGSIWTQNGSRALRVARARDRNDFDQLEHVGTRVDAVRGVQAVRRGARARAARTRAVHRAEERLHVNRMTLTRQGGRPPSPPRLGHRSRRARSRTLRRRALARRTA